MQGSMRREREQAGAAEQLSAAMDGVWDEADEPSMSLSPADRRTWSLYHLVGDTLRSDDLATPPAAARDFAARFAARLASEPSHASAPAVSIAPAARRPGARQAAGGQGWGWGQSLGRAARRALGGRVMPSFAAAAAVATLAWVLVPAPHGGATQMAGLSTSGGATPLAARDHWQRVNLGSDPQLDPYLEAHQQFASDHGGLGYAAYAALAPTGH